MQVRKEAERHAIFDCARLRALFSREACFAGAVGCAPRRGRLGGKRARARAVKSRALPGFWGLSIFY